jgi:hypothetical protein
MLLDKSVPGEEPLVVFKFSNAPSTFNKRYQRKGMENATF